MNTIFRSVAIPYFIILLVVVIVVKLLSLGLFYFLPYNGVDHTNANKQTAKYRHFNIKTMISKKEKKKKIKLKTQNTTATMNHLNLILKGIYKSNQGSYIFIGKKNVSKIEILAIDEIYEGYTLSLIKKSYVIMRKNNKDYKLELNPSAKKEIARYISNKVEEIIAQNSTRQISRSVIGSYTKNINKIWKDVSIGERKINGKINGFKVNSVRRDSDVYRMGLRKGDVILKANNKELSSYNDAFAIYGKMKKMKYLNLVILRNNQEMEIVYEIN
jgi:general secretion pathway protein C